MVYIALSVAYLLFSASGVWAVVKYFTMPHWNPCYEAEGLDVSWCLLVVMVIVSLIPPVNVSMNCFWLLVIRQQIKRRPLIKWSRFTLPKINLPKCPIAVSGKRRAIL